MKNQQTSESANHQLSLDPEISGSSHINVGTGERMVSVAAGAALVYMGFRKFSFTNVLLGLVGGALLKRGLTGYCEVNDYMGRDTASLDGVPVVVQQSVTINKSREDVYNTWRRVENFPTFMRYITEVGRLDIEGKRYHWQMEIPKLGKKIDWEAEVVEDRPNERILYRTYNGSDVSQSGEILFKDAAQGQGTELQATIKYYAPAGYIGGGVAKLLNPTIEQVVQEDMLRFKQMVETGDVPTRDGHPEDREV